MNFAIYSLQSITADISSACAKLFTENYGEWSIGTGRVTISNANLRRGYLFDDSCFLALAMDASSNEIVGHAAFVKFSCEGKDPCVWITQLVVHRDYRSRGIAQTLLRIAIGTDWKVAGIASSHPHALLALEKAAGSRFEPAQFGGSVESLLLSSKVPYLCKKASKVTWNHVRCVIDTEYNVEHCIVDEALRQSVAAGRWRYGADILQPGTEFIGVALRD